MGDRTFVPAEKVPEGGVDVLLNKILLGKA
jgi:hypothetical protein